MSEELETWAKERLTEVDAEIEEVACAVANAASDLRVYKTKLALLEQQRDSLQKVLDGEPLVKEPEEPKRSTRPTKAQLADRLDAIKRVLKASSTPLSPSDIAAKLGLVSHQVSLMLTEDNGIVRVDRGLYGLVA